MKKILALFIIANFLYIKIIDAQILDSAYFQCLYKLTYSKDLTKLNDSGTDEMLLLVGESYTSYKSYLNFIADSLRKANPAEYMPQMIGNKVHAVKKKAKETTNIERLYLNRKTGNLTTMGKLHFQTILKYDETIVSPLWNIENEHKFILDYKCQKATTRYGGRNWTVWFAPEIAIDEGPWKLRGLPGLILEAEDSDKHYIFECIGLQRLKKRKPIEKDSDKMHQTVKKDEFNKRAKTVYDNPYAILNDLDGITIKSTSQPLKTVNRKYNPIELD